MRRKRFGSSFFFVAAGGYSQLLCEFFNVVNVNKFFSFLSVNQMKITSFWFEQLSFAQWIQGCIVLKEVGGRLA